jgi:hypothetical protein
MLYLYRNKSNIRLPIELGSFLIEVCIIWICNGLFIILFTISRKCSSFTHKLRSRTSRDGKTIVCRKFSSLVHPEALKWMRCLTNPMDSWIVVKFIQSSSHNSLKLSTLDTSGIVLIDWLFDKFMTVKYENCCKKKVNQIKLLSYVKKRNEKNK